MWIDGYRPWGLRSKIKIHELSKGLIDGIAEKNSVRGIPAWGFDGSSTNQAEGDSSDCLLSPVYAVKDPLRDDDISFIVL